MSASYYADDILYQKQNINLVLMAGKHRSLIKKKLKNLEKKVFPINEEKSLKSGFLILRSSKSVDR